MLTVGAVAVGGVGAVWVHGFSGRLKHGAVGCDVLDLSDHLSSGRDLGNM